MAKSKCDESDCLKKGRFICVTSLTGDKIIPFSTLNYAEVSQDQPFKWDLENSLIQNQLSANVCQKERFTQKGAINFPTADKIDGQQKFLRNKIVIKYQSEKRFTKQKTKTAINFGENLRSTEVLSQQIILPENSLIEQSFRREKINWCYFALILHRRVKLRA